MLTSYLTLKGKNWSKYRDRLLLVSTLYNDKILRQNIKVSCPICIHIIYTYNRNQPKSIIAKTRLKSRAVIVKRKLVFG